MKRHLRIASSLALLAMTPCIVLAQTPSLPLPEAPTQPLTVIFKDVTRHDLFRLVVQALKQSKRVDPFVMKRARRSFIEYEGKFFGDSVALVDGLKQAVEGKLNIESKTKGDGGLELVVTPQSP